MCTWDFCRYAEQVPRLFIPCTFYATRPKCCKTSRLLNNRLFVLGAVEHPHSYIICNKYCKELHFKVQVPVNEPGVRHLAEEGLRIVHSMPQLEAVSFSVAAEAERSTFMEPRLATEPVFCICRCTRELYTPCWSISCSWVPYKNTYGTFDFSHQWVQRTRSPRDTWQAEETSPISGSGDNPHTA